MNFPCRISAKPTDALGVGPTWQKASGSSYWVSDREEELLIVCMNYVSACYKEVLLCISERPNIIMKSAVWFFTCVHFSSFKSALVLTFE